ncbi:MAG: DUF6134 family protein [Ferrovibrio sp.]|uniref:DUF6134 family protein n=1 Tax=Ferrovibrio sp. TaxID=1917215 RepID=UPI00391ABD07
MGKAVLIASLAAAIGFGTAHAAEVETRDFEVFRNGERIGYHRVDIVRDADRSVVNVDINLRVTFGPLTLYRYIHQSREEWQGDRLVSLVSSTDNDGDEEKLRAVAEGDRLKVSGTRFTGMLPADTMPTSYWRSDFVRRATIMDSQNGRVLDLQVRPESFEMASAARDEIPARRYHLSGDIDLTLWYDRDGRWVKSAFKATDGSQVEYRLR